MARGRTWALLLLIKAASYTSPSLLRSEHFSFIHYSFVHLPRVLLRDELGASRKYDLPSQIIQLLMDLVVWIQSGSNKMVEVHIFLSLKSTLMFVVKKMSKFISKIVSKHSRFSVSSRSSCLGSKRSSLVVVWSYPLA